MMANTKAVTENGVKINIERADNILRWLIRLEAENLRTKDLNDARMISRIQKRIEEEMQCY